MTLNWPRTPKKNFTMNSRACAKKNYRHNFDPKLATDSEKTNFTMNSRACAKKNFFLHNFDPKLATNTEKKNFTMNSRARAKKNFSPKFLSLNWPRTRPAGPRPRPPDFAGKKKKKKRFGTQPQTPRPLSDFSPVHTHTSYRVFPVWLTHQTPILVFKPVFV